MACTAKELKDWVATIDDEKVVAIDDGGLTLVVYGADADIEERKNAANDAETCGAYFEIGGVPEPEDD